MIKINFFFSLKLIILFVSCLTNEIFAMKPDNADNDKVQYSATQKDDKEGKGNTLPTRPSTAKPSEIKCKVRNNDWRHAENQKPKAKLNSQHSTNPRFFLTIRKLKLRGSKVNLIELGNILAELDLYIEFFGAPPPHIHFDEYTTCLLLAIPIHQLMEAAVMWRDRSISKKTFVKIMSFFINYNYTTTKKSDIKQPLAIETFYKTADPFELLCLFSYQGLKRTFNLKSHIHRINVSKLLLKFYLTKITLKNTGREISLLAYYIGKYHSVPRTTRWFHRKGYKFAEADDFDFKISRNPYYWDKLLRYFLPSFELATEGTAQQEGSGMNIVLNYLAQKHALTQLDGTIIADVKTSKTNSKPQVSPCKIDISEQEKTWAQNDIDYLEGAYLARELKPHYTDTEHFKLLLNLIHSYSLELSHIRDQWRYDKRFEDIAKAFLSTMHESEIRKNIVTFLPVFCDNVYYQEQIMYALLNKDHAKSHEIKLVLSRLLNLPRSIHETYHWKPNYTCIQQLKILDTETESKDIALREKFYRSLNK